MKTSYKKSKIFKLLSTAFYIFTLCSILLSVLFNIYIVLAGQQITAIISDVHSSRRNITVQFIDENGRSHEERGYFPLAGWIENHWINDKVEIYYLPDAPYPFNFRVNNINTLFIFPGIGVAFIGGLYFVFHKRKKRE